MGTSKGLQIGEIVRRTGVSADTLRFYEERGILPPAGRTDGGFRLFSPDTPERLAFVGRAKALGFSLDEIMELLSLRSSKAKDSHQVLDKVHEKLREVDHRLAELGKLREALVDLASTCDGSHPVCSCPILESFGRSPEVVHGIP